MQKISNLEKQKSEMPVVTTDRILALVILSIIFSHTQAADGDCANKEYATVRIPTCPRAIFRPPNHPGFTRFQVGIDENQQPYSVCRANLTGTLLLGKGYSQSRFVNGAWIYENCWVAAPNGTELLVTAQDKVQYLVYENTRPYNLLWVSIEKFNCFPTSTLSSKTGPLPNSTKQYIGRYTYETEDGIGIKLPGAINGDDTEVIVGTYGGAIIKDIHYELPVCM